jgi:hypothetical protein
MRLKKPDKNDSSRAKRQRVAIATIVALILFASFLLSPDLPLAGRLVGCLFTLGFLIAALREDEDVDEPPFIP